MKNEGMKRRVIRYQRKIEHIRKLIGELKQYVDTVELKPVSEEAIIKLERHLKKKLSDEYVAFLYYIGSGRLDYTLFTPASFLTWIEEYLQQRIWFYQMKRKSLHGE